MGKRVLILNASHNDERLILALKKLGCYVITTGNRPELVGHKLADEYVYGNYTDLDAMLQLAIDKKVEAVCPCCNDFGVKTAAYISEKLGFSGQDSFETTLIIHDKDRFKKFAAELGGINTPLATNFDDEQAALAWAETADGFPLIIKPVDLSAGNGIKRADNREELMDNIRNAFATSREKRVVVEPFVTGTQHGFCTYLINQKVVAYCSNNEDSFINPYRVEADSFPADHVELVADDLIAQIERMAQALHLVDGIFHLQYIFSNGRAHILECMRRVLGNLYSVPAEGLGEGFDWDYWEVKAKCGFGVEDFPASVPCTGHWAYRALIAEENGVFKGVQVDDDIQPFIYSTWMLQEPGHVIENHMSDPMGFLFLKFSSQEEMHHIIIDRHTGVKILVE